MKPASIFALTLLAALPALAASDVTWVASYGTNNVTCSRTSPCDTFATALAVTNANGVIRAIDAGSYGQITITQNVTIDGNGVAAEIDCLFANGVYINNPGVQVTIRDVTIRSICGTGVLIRGGDLHLENVLIVGAETTGVLVDGSTSTSRLTAKNLTVANPSNWGILVQGGSASLRDSVMRGGPYGIYVQSLPGHPAVALVDRCELSYNVVGLVADNTGGSGATVRLSDTVITANDNGIFTTAGGQIITFRTNMLAGNGTDGSTPFSISLK
jgi:hypothetical protein